MKKTDFYQRRNPIDEYRTGGYPKQEQPYPGVQKKMDPVPDCGETSYAGNNRLHGRKALITGGDSGIGRAAAIAYAREGADIAVNYLPAEEEDAQDLKKLLEKEKRKVELFPGDLADEKFCAELVRRAEKKLGGLDILALVAGRQIATKSIEDISTKQLQEVFAINVYSLFWVVKAALPLLPPVRPSSPPPPSRPTNPAPISSITPRPKARSRRSARLWASSWRKRAFASTRWRRGRSGQHCRYRVGNFRTSCPSSGRTRRTNAPDSRWNWRDYMSSWLHRNQAILRPRCSA